MKDSFIFYTEYREAISRMKDEQAGMLLKALIEYTDGNEPVISDQAVEMVFLTIKPRMDRDREKWEQERERRSNAGRKGGIVRSSNAKQSQAVPSNAKQSQAVPSNAKQSQAMQADTDCDCDIDYESNNPPLSPLGGKPEAQTEMFKRLSAGREIPSALKDALMDWISYKKQRREPYKEAGMRSLISQAVNKANDYGPAAVAEIIREAMSSNYKGIVWDRLVKKRPPGAKFNNSPPRNYQMDELEKRLLATN